MLSKSVILKMKVIDMGDAGRDYATGQRKKRYVIRDEDGILKDEIELMCTSNELERKLAQIRIQFNSIYGHNATQFPSDRYRSTSYFKEPNRSVGTPVGWSCRQAGEQALRTVGVPATIAKAGAVGLDMFLGVKMHKDFLTSGKDLKRGFENVFKW